MSDRPPVTLSPAQPPGRSALEGRNVRLEPLQVDAHAGALFDDARAAGSALWDYMAYGPFEDRAVFASWLGERAASEDPLFFAILPRGAERAAGMASYLRITPAMATIEIGHIWFGAHLQRTIAATEAIFLMIDRAFSLGYRRVEWKCDALNEASRRAARRLGFRFEGIFRQHMIVKGRNRDTAWYAVLDQEWPALRLGYEAWFAPDNFDADGRQLRALASCVGRSIEPGSLEVRWSGPTDDGRTLRPTLEAARLRLRPFRATDADDVERIANDERIASTTRLPYPYPKGLAARWIASHEGAYRAGVDATWALEHDGRLVGALSLMHIDRANGHGELGFWIDPEVWGRGYATEAAAAALSWAFDVAGLNRLYAFHVTRNVASQRVLEKIGMRNEGRLRGHLRKGGVFEDLVVMARMRRDPGASGSGQDPREA